MTHALTQLMLGLIALTCSVSSFYLLVNGYGAWWYFFVAAACATVALCLNDDICNRRPPDR